MSRNRRNSGEKRGDLGGKRNYDEDNPVPGGGGEPLRNNEGIRGGDNGAPVKNEEKSENNQKHSNGDQGNHYAYGRDNDKGNNDNDRGNSSGDQGNHYAYGRDKDKGNNGRRNSGNYSGYEEEHSNRPDGSGNQGNHYAYGHDNSNRDRPQQSSNRPIVVTVNLNQPQQQPQPQQININQTNVVTPAAPQTRPIQQPVSFGPPVDTNQLKPLPNTANLLPDTKTTGPNVQPPPLKGLPQQYSGLSWTKKQVPPPPININSLLADAPQTKVEANLMQLDEAAVKDAMIANVNGRCCYNSKCALECNITKVTPMSALHYKLETFTERRSISYEYVPFNNGPFDGPDRGPVPDPWSIQVNSQLFSNGTQKMPVPHSDQIMGCFKCNSQGALRCQNCNGSGGKVCSTCQGKRYTMDPQGNKENCRGCNGSGTEKCIRCSGRGSVTCNNCEGTGKLRVFIEIEISFKNRLNEYTIEESALPDHLIKYVSGDVLVNQTFAQVQPIMSFPDRRIVDNSKRIVESHRSFYSSEKPLMQRQELKAVAVTECEYQWNDYRSRFWVYGNERCVYFEDYPQKCCGCCCCCCTII